MAAIDRREFLRRSTRAALALSSVALAGTIAGCTTESERSSSTTTTTLAPSTTLAPTTTTAPPRTLAQLKAVLEGELVLPDDPGYGQARLVYDLRYADAAPAGIAYCESAGDVARSLDCARSVGLAPIPRCGGHSYGGYSTGSGLVIDVTRLDSTAFDPASATMRVGAGALLIDLYAACATAGVLVPGGSCPTVGIAGLTLGGGVGVLGRRYGLTCDNLVALEIVGADGTLLTCSANEHADLFWACRGGGGGNFGIVTSFTFATHPIPELSLFTCDWSFDGAGEVLSAWQDWMRAAPDALWSNCQLQSAGSDGTLVRSSGVYTGSPQALQGLLDSLLRETPSPTYSTVDANGYLETMLIEAGCEGLTVAACHLAGASPDGTLERALFDAKSAYFSALLPDSAVAVALDAITSVAESEPGLGAALVFDAYGGAINDVPSDATAFVHRDALFALQMNLSFSPSASSSEVLTDAAWLATTERQLAPFSNGQAYQNYIDPTLSNWQDAYYGTNLARLEAVKAAYDPDDAFHFAQSIPR